MGDTIGSRALARDYPDPAQRAVISRMVYVMRMEGGWEIAEIATAWGITELVVHELIAYYVRFVR